MATPTATPHEWSKAALFPKALRCVEEMQKYQHEDWQFGFWSSLALELLARAALAHVSQVLLADATQWHNVLYALGRSPLAPKFNPKSVPVGAVIERLGEVAPAFTKDLQDFALVHMGKRNQEVHSGSLPFDALKPDSWLHKYYETCDALLTSMGETLEAYVGADETKAARALIAAAKDDTAKAVKKTIEAHKTVWTNKDTTEQGKLHTQATAWATKQSGHRVKCPACANDALVFGSPVAPPNRKLDEDTIEETQTFLPGRFECIACGLKIGALSQLYAAGLGATYKSTITYDAAEFFRVEDPYPEFEPDNNEP